ncbi:hypothetical protein [Vampirovibrio chlorellavorus]|uniref:hypothetical protein n=1 Tax=Vampirovibrio chlorellavorus TaxID=758823 RepID=UPI0026ECA695|nr:hypothetical protein [Vampirovibrio chlorellavorus]
MKKNSEPHEVARYFFQTLLQSQVQVCWGLFTDHSQKEFVQWTMKDIYQQNPKAAQAAKLGPPEVKLMFETNNLDLVLRFWRRFVRQSQAAQFARYGYFSTLSIQGKTATVEAHLVFPNGQEQRVNLIMVNERGDWRLGYLESNMPF